MKLTLGFSPCPNDTFIFDALVNKKIDTAGIDFDVVLEDVQTLNQQALSNALDISKISYGVLPLVLNNYRVLNSGGALGIGVGPLLIANKPVKELSEVGEMRVAIPGQNTTAHLLFSLAFPQAVKKQFVVFNQVEDAVLNGAADAGVIIHENRFTYQQRGLVQLMDLGSYWETITRVPIPLGGIIIKKTFSTEVMQTIDRLIHQSVAFAFEHYPHLPDYVKAHAQEMNESVMKQHIDLYVNQFSAHLGEAGKASIQKLLQVSASINNLEFQPDDSIFVAPI